MGYADFGLASRSECGGGSGGAAGAAATAVDMMLWIVARSRSIAASAELPGWTDAQELMTTSATRKSAYAITGRLQRYAP